VYSPELYRGIAYHMIQRHCKFPAFFWHCYRWIDSAGRKWSCEEIIKAGWGMWFCDGIMLGYIIPEDFAGKRT